MAADTGEVGLKEQLSGESGQFDRMLVAELFE